MVLKNKPVQATPGPASRFGERDVKLPVRSGFPLRERAVYVLSIFMAEGQEPNIKIAHYFGWSTAYRTWQQERTRTCGQSKT